MLRVLQVYILDAVAKMSITDAKDAESIVERVIPRLQHANSAVVLSAVKVSSGSQPTADARCQSTGQPVAQPSMRCLQ